MEAGWCGRRALLLESRWRERGGAGSVTTSINLIPGQPTASVMGMGGLVVRVERMEEAERGRVEGGSMTVNCIRIG